MDTDMWLRAAFRIATSWLKVTSFALILKVTNFRLKCRKNKQVVNCWGVIFKSEDLKEKTSK